MIDPVTGAMVVGAAQTYFKSDFGQKYSLGGKLTKALDGGGKKKPEDMYTKDQLKMMKLELEQAQRGNITDKAFQSIVQSTLAGGQTPNALRQAMNARDQSEVSGASLSRILEQNRASGLSTGSTEQGMQDFYNKNAANVITSQNKVAGQDYDRAFQAAYGATKATKVGMAPAVPAPQESGVIGGIAKL